jgi:Xaa-Pro aminopeptidase
MHGRMSGLALLVAAAVAAGAARAQPAHLAVFPSEEFAARRARVFDAIGDGLAILQGATERPAFLAFRQNNHFFYLTGVEVPRAVVVLDGRARAATLLLPPRDERRERSEGPLLGPGPEAERLTGIERVLDRDRLGEVVLAAARDRRVIYTPFRPESLGAATPERAAAHAAATAADPWDGRPSREAAFIAKLRALVPSAEIRDLDPILDALRMRKSPREIALIREATRIAGLALMEVMRSAAPGMYEYELAAIGDYFFRKFNAQGPAYFALVAAGANARYPHYHAAQSRLVAGDLVLFDYAPDFHYYTADVTRMFPASGRFSLAQRELYTLYLRLYQALLESIRPYVSPREIRREAARKMRERLAAFGPLDPRHRAAAERLIEQIATSERADLGHFVGMEVHDVAGPYEVLEPGMVLTIEPALTLPDTQEYIRLEDVILITDTGYENLSGFVPVEPDEIERLMAERGLFEGRDP